MSKFLIPDLFNMFTGMRFGQMEVKTGLCHILSRFEVAPCKETPVPLVFDPKNPLMVAKGNMFLSFKQKTL
jgi:cytochrome P450 family 6